MIISLDKLKKLLGDNLVAAIDDDLLQHKLDGIESSIRTLTNNNFIDERVKSCCNELEFKGDTITSLNSTTDFVKMGFRDGDTLLVDNSLMNDGMYEISAVLHDTIVITESKFIDEISVNDCTVIAKVVYPYDILAGVVNLIKYDLTLGDKVGIKSETIARYSVTYYDANSSENINGYPAALFNFVYKYRKMRW